MSELRRLDELEPSWLAWLCEALSEGADEQELCALLHERGERDPLALLRALKAHPIYAWAAQKQHQNQHQQQHSLKAERSRLRLERQRAERYRELHEALWALREVPLTRLHLPSPERFFEDFYSALRPLVITGWASEWAALERWRPELWRERFAEVSVQVSRGREGDPLFDRHGPQLNQETTLGAFAAELLSRQTPSNDAYLIARGHALEQPALKPLLNDIDERPYLDPERREGSVALWFGPAGTFTPLHHDTCQIMFVQLLGRKTFTLIPPHAQGLFDHATNMYANVSPARDLEREPLHPHQLTLTLEPGEALFLPVGWWHAVRAHDLSISLAMTHFMRPNRFAWYEPNRGFSSLKG